MSTSKPELVLNEYTGTHGCYVCMIPIDSSKDTIIELCEKLGIATDKDKMHCTLMYSKDNAPAPTDITELPSDSTIHCLAHNVRHWVGHDGKTYIVMSLAGSEILLEHARLLKCGAVHSFVPFEPHITLTSDVKITEEVQAKIDEINKYLGRNPTTIVLGTEKISDIKAD